MAEPIEMTFGVWTWVGPSNHVLDGSALANTTELSTCGGNVGFLSNYFDHLFIYRLLVSLRWSPCKREHTRRTVGTDDTSLKLVASEWPQWSLLLQLLHTDDIQLVSHVTEYSQHLYHLSIIIIIIININDM